MMKREYTLLVPSLERKGPVNVAVDIGLAAHAAGWHVKILYLSNSTISGGDLSFAAEVRQFRMKDLWQLRGVVHTHCLRPDLYGILLARNPQVILVTTIHSFFLFDLGFEKNKFLVTAAWQVWKRALSCFDVVVCISATMCRYYKRTLPNQLFELAYNFRGEALKVPAPEMTTQWIKCQRDAGRVVLSFVGVLSERKNILGLIEALAQDSTLSLVICGDGPLRKLLEQLMYSLSVSERVRFEGQVLVPSAIVSHVDALILPSFAEGFPLAVIEAAAVGVPSLMSNIAVHREIASLGFGRVFDHHRFSDLGSGARQLIKDLPAPSPKLVDIWAAQFSPRVGFSKYEALIAQAQM